MGKFIILLNSSLAALVTLLISTAQVSLMERCWHKRPGKRPSFDEVATHIMENFLGNSETKVRERKKSGRASSRSQDGRKNSRAFIDVHVNTGKVTRIRSSVI